MQYLLNTRFMIAVHLTIAAALLSLFAYLVHAERSEQVSALRERIQEEEELLIMLADLTDRNAATDDITTIVRDCTGRNRFDELLGSLGTLDMQELLTTQQLFDACGGYFARKKALMVAKMERELQSLNSYISLLGIIEDTAPEKRRSERLAMLIEREHDRSRLLTELVAIQRDIITALIQGSGVQSAVVTESLSQAEDVNQSLAVADAQIDTIRDELRK